MLEVKNGNLTKMSKNHGLENVSPENLASRVEVGSSSLNKYDEFDTFLVVQDFSHQQCFSYHPTLHFSYITELHWNLM